RLGRDGLGPGARTAPRRVPGHGGLRRLVERVGWTRGHAGEYPAAALGFHALATDPYGLIVATRRERRRREQVRRLSAPASRSRASGIATSAPPSRTTRVTPPASSWDDTRPWRRFSIPAAAASASTGMARRSRGAPRASTAPSRRRSTRSASATASPTLWVTYSAGTLHSSRIRSR